MSYSLFELNEFIRQVLALNLSEAVWVKCELVQVRVSRGHCYVELVEKSEENGEIIAQGSAVIWNRQLLRLRNKLGLELDALLREGMEVLLQAKVEFHERYGLKLIIEDFDTAYTLGKLEMQRQATIGQLKSEGLLEKNGQLPLPAVIQRVAVLSSATAAGLQDFLQQLRSNAYGYRFEVELFQTAMQGAKVGAEFEKQLRRIRRSRKSFDTVAVIRGGGSKLNLAAFDKLELCSTVAKMPLPVLTGIGHDIDETVLDVVAHTSLKTPTAVAEFLVQHNLQFEMKMLELGQAVKFFAEQKIHSQQVLLEKYAQVVEFQSLGILRQQNMMLEFIQNEIPRQAEHLLKNEKLKLHGLEQTVNLLSPETAFKRGFSLTTKNGKVVTDANELSAGDEVKTQLKEGHFTSTVKKRNNG